AARQVLAFDAANRQVIGTYNNDGVLQAFTWNVRTGNPSTTRLYVDGGGNVGIGTTAPGAPLQIGDLTPDDVPARLRFASHHGTGGGVWDLGTGVDTSSDAARYGFAIRDQQMGATRIAVGATTGYVGIGTVTPSERLEVGGNVRASAIGLGVNPSFPLHVVGGAYLTGNVGIGTMSPSAKLHVEGGEIMSTGDPGQQAGRISAREFYGLSANGQGKKVADYSGCYYA
ncbi:MAG: hypothetical protein IT305_00925, partial [Chloroflexi bacterium]|nr:hypothetical protein [Chloroflexota bacterium]